MLSCAFCRRLRRLLRTALPLPLRDDGGGKRQVEKEKGFPGGAGRRWWPPLPRSDGRGAAVGEIYCFVLLFRQPCVESGSGGAAGDSTTVGMMTSQQCTDKRPQKREGVEVEGGGGLLGI